MSPLPDTSAIFDSLFKELCELPDGEGNVGRLNVRLERTFLKTAGKSRYRIRVTSSEGWLTGDELENVIKVLHGDLYGEVLWGQIQNNGFEIERIT